MAPICRNFETINLQVSTVLDKKSGNLTFENIFRSVDGVLSMPGCLTTQLACLWGGLVTVLCPPRKEPSPFIVL
jgi:hypothetical protein